MKIYREESLTNFDFWGGAKHRVNYFTLEELQTIEAILEDCYPDGIDETAINDLFWFEEDTLAEWLGFTDFDDLIESHKI